LTFRWKPWLVAGAAWLGAALAAPSGAGTRDDTLRNEYPGAPVPGLSATQARAFDDGALLFSRIWQPGEGLGRAHNATSCAQCHHNPLPGGNEFAPHAFVAHSPQCSDPVGGRSCAKLRLDDADRPVPTTLPRDARMRKPQSLFGLGMLAAVPDDALLALARSQQDDPDGVRGVVGRDAAGRVARFGWKSRFASIDDFVAAAFRAEFGMTSDHYPGSKDDGDRRVEVTRETIDLVSDFIRYLAAPPLTPRGDVGRGRELFSQLRCTACHVPSLQTAADAPAPFRARTVFAYSDMLLHDMGDSMSDRIAEGLARPSQFRTPPLWGLNASGPPYLHDGRARSVDSAIRLHDGEARLSAERYSRLPADDAQALLRFLDSL
jgi:CxxC motif-containing protein (DUF1111 family)